MNKLFDTENEKKNGNKKGKNKTTKRRPNSTTGTRASGGTE
ncbi:hypothetical protein [Leptospira kemamanensis]|nr:hypothetical protein [Leptospira kemamanensis]